MGADRASEARQVVSLETPSGGWWCACRRPPPSGSQCHCSPVTRDPAHEAVAWRAGRRGPSRGSGSASRAKRGKGGLESLRVATTLGASQRKRLGESALHEMRCHSIELRLLPMYTTLLGRLLERLVQ
jgi:hypothetical protein